MDLRTSLIDIEPLSSESADTTTMTPGGRAADSTSFRKTAIALEADVASTTTSLPNVIADQWTRIALSELSVRLANKLTKVAMTQSGPAPTALKESSLKSFLTFWSLVRDVASEPELGLSPDGSLYAEWYSSPRKRLDIKFNDEKNVVYGFFDNKRLHEGIEQAQALAVALRNDIGAPLKWGSQ